MQVNHSLLISELSTSIIDKDTRDPCLVSRTSSSEKRAGKKISKFTNSPMPSGSSLESAKERRSANSKLQSGSSMRNRRVESPLPERTMQSSMDAEETVPLMANAISTDSTRKSSGVCSSAHFRNIKSALPESIILSPGREERIRKKSEKVARKLAKEDRAKLLAFLAGVEARIAL